MLHSKPVKLSEIAKRNVVKLELDTNKIEINIGSPFWVDKQELDDLGVPYELYLDGFKKMVDYNEKTILVDKVILESVFDKNLSINPISGLFGIVYFFALGTEGDLSLNIENFTANLKIWIEEDKKQLPLDGIGTEHNFGNWTEWSKWSDRTNWFKEKIVHDGVYCQVE